MTMALPVRYSTGLQPARNITTLAASEISAMRLDAVVVTDGRGLISWRCDRCEAPFEVVLLPDHPVTIEGWHACSCPLDGVPTDRWGTTRTPGIDD